MIFVISSLSDCIYRRQNEPYLKILGVIFLKQMMLQLAHLNVIRFNQGSSNIVRGPHKLFHNSSRAEHKLPVQIKRMPNHECCLTIKVDLLERLVKLLL